MHALLLPAVCIFASLHPPVCIPPSPPVLALKAVPSKDLGTDVWSPTDSLTSQVVADQQAQPESATPRTTVSGHYSYYDDPYGLDVGTSFRTPEGAAAFSSLQDCIDACDDEPA